MLLNAPVTWVPLEKAQRIAEFNNRYDPDWKYVAVPVDGKPHLAKVIMFDEDGVEVGSL